MKNLLNKVAVQPNKVSCATFSGVAYLAVGFILVVCLEGCTFLPGMTAHYYKSAIVEESPESPNTLDYTLVAVTPLLVQKMMAEQLEIKSKEVGPGPFGNAEPTPYRLGNFDVLRIFVWGNPDLSPVLNMAGSAGVASTPVGRNINDKGDLFFPLVGTIHASGLTISEFREELTRRLSKYIKDPQIDVDVSAFRSQKVYVTGEVRSNAYLQITDQPMRILDAIGQAGGLTPTADMYTVNLTRGKTSAQIDLERAYYGGDTSANVLLQGGDILSIPDNQNRKVFILGEFGNSAGINNARSYLLRRGRVSLAEVIGDAGGLNPFTAAAGKVFVMRADQNGEPLIYQLNARDPASLIMAEKFLIKPRDVVYVSPTDITEFGRFIAQFFPLTSGVATVNSTINTPGF